MADDPAVISDIGESPGPLLSAKNKKNAPKSSVRGKRNRSETTLGLKSANKRKRSTTLDSVELNDEAQEPLDDEEIEHLNQEKHRLLEELEKYAFRPENQPESQNSNAPELLSRRNSQSSVGQPSNTPEATSSFKHWDFLLQEMQWMATDFAQERKWRIRKAKTLSLSVTSYHNKRATANVRNLQQEEQARKRFAAKIGRDIKKYWLKIDKLVAHEVKVTQEEKRKESMESQLKFLLNQTEKYASALAATFSLETSDGVRTPARSESVAEDRSIHSDNDSDFEFDEKTNEIDDETTIEAEEKLQTRDEVDEEVALLNEESEMSIEELRAKYMQNIPASEDSSGEDEAPIESDEEFVYKGDDEMDDETTIELEEKAQSKAEVDEEVALLEEESTMSIEELRAKYAALESNEDESVADDGSVESECEEIVQDGNKVSQSPRPSKSSPANQEVEDERNDSDVDFEYDEREDFDDETTIENEEKLQNKADVDAEVALLQAESTMSIEEFRAKYEAMSKGFEYESYDGDEMESNPDSHSVNDVEENAIKSDEANEKAEEVDPQNAEDNTQEELADVNPLSNQNNFQEAIKDKKSEDANSNDVWKDVGLVRPFLLRNTLKLRAYQATGVAWLLSLAHNRMNGILADEMGLGKTIQTISMLASLAVEGIWGPHLVVVPTSCILNWEMEFKRWCPGFKVMTYYGSAKRRKDLRLGWSKLNAFQVCITSYQLVVADAHCFKRKKWYYLILDEAHNIKNWKSQRWQTLLNFNTQRRLLLTGTPLQNNLMELWALMHFLMPHLFRSRAQFSHWFNNPLNSMVEGETAVNDQLVSRLHNIIRPFVLRRLKKDVAKQMPGKFEHVVMCSLSKRQRFLYEDFMARSSTRKALSGGNFMGMMNVLMQLRKVCNHPDLFEPRPIMSPFDMPCIQYHYPFTMSSFQSTKSSHWMLNQSKFSSILASNRRIELKPTMKAFIEDVTLPEAPSINSTHHELIAKHLLQQHTLQKAARQFKIAANAWLNHWRCLEVPFLSIECIRKCTMPIFFSHAMEAHRLTQFETSNAMKAMVKSPHERLETWMEIMLKVLCFVYKARTTSPEIVIGSSLSAGWVHDAKQYNETSHEIEKSLAPLGTHYHPIQQRHHLFFPDKRLIQFDCGKLQQLDRLLRQLKRDSHRCLIFSQMSSMLNILEIFLNVHGHTYFRLDGSTPVERRQRLMDKFNSDTKIFCFILSTRSGGLGINLTGADTVIFYDSDWNPAMDAQAQDRAHRIGQTRDVHIYRMVSEHTVEENILKKAQQKRHLDFLVLSEGQFTTDYFTKSNLRELIANEDNDSKEDDEDVDVSTIEDAMAQCEDQEDVAAMKGVKLEQRVEKEQDEQFDDDVMSVDSQDANNSSIISATIGLDLRQIDTYAMNFRKSVDPLFQYVELPPMQNDEQEELELERIEANKIVDEEVAILEGELIASAETMEYSLQKKIYHVERSHLKRERRRRAMTGAAWIRKTCSRSNQPFYYNTDTHEAIWDCPLILVQQEEHSHARSIGYGGLPLNLLHEILSYCTPKERMSASVCTSWTKACQNPAFHKRIHCDATHLESIFENLLPADTLAFSPGVYSIATPIIIYHPIRLVASTSGGTCTLEFQNDTKLIWSARNGEINGLQFIHKGSSSRRQTIVQISTNATCSINSCHFEDGDSCLLVQGGTALLNMCTVTHARGSGIVVEGGYLALAGSTIANNGRCGVTMIHGGGIFRKNDFDENLRYGIRLLSGVQMAVLHSNQFVNNICGAMDIEHAHRRIFIRNSNIIQEKEAPRPHVHESIQFRDLRKLCDICDPPKPPKVKTEASKIENMVNAFKEESVSLIVDGAIQTEKSPLDLLKKSNDEETIVKEEGVATFV